MKLHKYKVNQVVYGVIYDPSEFYENETEVIICGEIRLISISPAGVFYDIGAYRIKEAHIATSFEWAVEIHKFLSK